MSNTIQSLVKKIMNLSAEFDINFYSASAGLTFVNFVPANYKRVYLFFYNTATAAPTFLRPLGSSDTVGIFLPPATMQSILEFEIDKSLVLCQTAWQGRFGAMGPNTLRAIDVVARG